MKKQLTLIHLIWFALEIILFIVSTYLLTPLIQIKFNLPYTSSLILVAIVVLLILWAVIKPIFMKICNPPERLIDKYFGIDRDAKEPFIRDKTDRIDRMEKQKAKTL
ncbi:MAG TPA: hypothetical protein VJK51_00830 [Candidatus Nanoarchaeia archaeon]|nr:hypothetical protein [Candidatus Nanoarchaeia archaeon]